MAISLDYGFTAPGSTKNLAINDVDYADWAVKSEKTDLASGSVRVDYVNITSPLDRQATSRTIREKIQDVYRNSGINPIYQSPMKEGVRITHTDTFRLKITDSEVPGQQIYVPFGLSTSFFTGVNANIGGTQLLYLLKEHLGMLFPKGSVTVNQLAGWLAGSITNLDETPEP